MSNTIQTPDSVQLIDSTATALVSNGTIPRGDLIQVLTRAINYYQHAGRPLYHFWGGENTTNELNLLRFVRFNTLDGGGQNQRALIGVVTNTGTVTANQGIRTTVGGAALSPDTFWGSGANASSYPEDMIPVDVAGRTQVNSPGIAEDYKFGPRDTNSPFLMSGCFYEDAVAWEDPAKTVIGDSFTPGGDILAAKSGSVSTLNQLRDRFTHVWKNRRPSIGWSYKRPGDLANFGYIDFTTAKTSYRYIFDQTVGTGGTAPSATGPGISFPLRYSAAGRRTQVRVYVWVYAAMSGATNTGTIAIANKDSGGTMGAMTAVTNPVTISGTAFTWYPTTGSWDPSTGAHFDGYAGGAFDRILLGAKSSGATDSVRIAAFQMVAFHSTL